MSHPTRFCVPVLVAAAMVALPTSLLRAQDSAAAPTQLILEDDAARDRPVRKSALNTAAAATRHLANGFRTLDKPRDIIGAITPVVHTARQSNVQQTKRWLKIA